MLSPGSLNDLGRLLQARDNTRDTLPWPSTDACGRVGVAVAGGVAAVRQGAAIGEGGQLSRAGRLSVYIIPVPFTCP